MIRSGILLDVVSANSKGIGTVQRTQHVVGGDMQASISKREEGQE